MFGWPKFPIAHVKNSQPKKHYASGFCHALSKIYSQSNVRLFKAGYNRACLKNQSRCLF